MQKAKFLFVGSLTLLALSHPDLNAALVNPSFEAGLSGWTADPVTFPSGDASFPIGVDGTGAANMGTFDQPGSFIYQTVPVGGGPGSVSFALGANSPYVGFTASVQLSVLDSSGTPLATGVYSVDSLGFLSGPTGFQTYTLSFDVPVGGTDLTVRFDDVSPNGGAAVDPLVDNVLLNAAAPPPPPPPPANLVNAGFEQQLSGWTHDVSTYPIGNSGQPIGSVGVSAANLGTFDQPGSFLAQTIAPTPGVKELSFDLGANGVYAGLSAAVSVTVSTSGGLTLAQAVYAVDSLGYVDRAAGFVPQNLGFTVPSSDSVITIRFDDVSPGGGYGVDVLLDNVRIRSGRATPGQLQNPSFELGLAGFFHDISTYPIGTADQPIGVAGNTSANLGTFDQPGSFLSQTITLRPGSQSVSFALGANGVGAGLTAAVEVRVVTASGRVLADRTFTARSRGVLNRGLGFDRKELKFVVPGNDPTVSLQFLDVSPGGGIAVDVLLDAIRLSGQRNDD